jgi:hypothetical protein
VWQIIRRVVLVEAIIFKRVVFSGNNQKSIDGL